MVSFSTVLFTLGTINFGTGVKFNEMTFIDDRNYPGGPLGFNFGRYSDWRNVLGFAASFALNWTSDAMLVSPIVAFPTQC